MTYFDSSYDIKYEEISLYLTDDNSNYSDGYNVTYSVYDSDGRPVSGSNLIPIRKSTGVYYAPWWPYGRSGSFKIVWRYRETINGEFYSSNNYFYIYDKNNFKSGKFVNDNGVPNKLYKQFIRGYCSNEFDFPIYITDNSGTLTDPYMICYSVIDKNGRIFVPRTYASQSSVGSYYAKFSLDLPAGSYKILWEYAESCNEPSTSIIDYFDIISPSFYYSDSCSGLGMTVYYSCCSNSIQFGNFNCLNYPSSIDDVCVSNCNKNCSPASTCCQGKYVPRIIHLANNTLPIAGQFTAQDSWSIPSGITKVTFYVTYKRSVPGGYPTFKLLWSNGTEETQETIINNSNATIDPLNLVTGSNLYQINGPLPDTDDPVNFIYYFSIPGGVSKVRLIAAEKGFPASPGFIQISLTASS